METEEFLGKVELFKDLDRASLSHLATKVQLVSLPEGPLVRKGDPGDALYIIKSGLASVTTSSGSDEIGIVLAELKSGDCFGEVALIDGRPRTADVTVTQPMECYKLPRDAFLVAVREHPEIAIGLLPRLATMVRASDEWLDDLLNRLTGRLL